MATAPTHSQARRACILGLTYVLHSIPLPTEVRILRCTSG